ncbi:hypothetical protein [Streptomyces sp. S.PNR 29]|uniref:hypothetical protein n=1 Tax=Streptomyces sp. S.PNR 29 TaxID=2973805 RepID=UPI0025B04394|nr:hypothetical protein [Streptomyces sp. S.PNR 29]MDN0193466.1 hypothetical protein [Streptomyces sp. S.PNR 29]
MHVASHAPALSGSFATAALNAGALVGPLLAGVATESTGDYRYAAWVSAGLAVVAVGVTGVVRDHASPGRAEE